MGGGVWVCSHVEYSLVTQVQLGESRNERVDEGSLGTLCVCVVSGGGGGRLRERGGLLYMCLWTELIILVISPTDHLRKPQSALLAGELSEFLLQQCSLWVTQTYQLDHSLECVHHAWR